MLKSATNFYKGRDVAKFSTSCIKFLEPEFTANANPDLKRGSFAEVTDKDVKFFEDLLSHRVIKGREGHNDDLDEYNVDWLHSFRGRYFPLRSSAHLR